MLPMMSETMLTVAELIGGEITDKQWIEFYSLMSENKMPTDFMAGLAEWEIIVNTWCDRTDIQIMREKLKEMDQEKKNIKELIGALSKLVKQVNNQEERIARLYSNYNVRKGWYLEINKDKIDYAIEMEHTYGITSNKRDKKIIVSLTSYPERMYDIKYTLYSLLHQTLKPDEVILWLAKEQFPNLEEDIAPSILNMKEWGLSIMWCEDIKSYKKLVPALNMFPDDIIVTADDDIYYPENWLELLYNSYIQNPDCVHCHRGHKVLLEEGKIASYNRWEKATSNKKPCFGVFATGCSGILYPPKALHEDVSKSEIFMELAPRVDDIWFWTMSLLNNTPIKIVDNGIKELNWINPARELGLYKETTLAMTNIVENDIYLSKMCEVYPEIMEILTAEINNQNRWEGSASYWQNRYLAGGTSGAGSYNRLAEFKAQVLNSLVEELQINTVIEWGCGDGNQLKLAKYPQYIGFDVSMQAVNICKSIFCDDKTKSFVWSGEEGFVNTQKAELALSLDVIYHLVEDEIFATYMQQLFSSSSHYVCIYSCNFDKMHATHVRCRKFTDYVADNFIEWKLVKVIKNAYPYDESNPDNTSWSDFYIYERI